MLNTAYSISDVSNGSPTSRKTILHSRYGSKGTGTAEFEIPSDKECVRASQEPPWKQLRDRSPLLRSGSLRRFPGDADEVPQPYLGGTMWVVPQTLGVDELHEEIDGVTP